jgi:protein-tyrosine phosphatase
MKTVLFLCTGNYYRSRFAEELFNHRASRLKLPWLAQSRGLAVERGIRNVGPLSLFALEALKRRGLVALGGDRMPRQCIDADLQEVDRIIALDEDEHDRSCSNAFRSGKSVPSIGASMTSSMSQPISLPTRSSGTSKP